MGTMGAYGFIQTLYIVAFGLFLGKQGFRWRWFLPLAGVFLAATLLTVPGFGKGLLPAALLAAAGDRRQFMAAPMMLIFYPLHAFVTVFVMSRLRDDPKGLERVALRVAVYMGAALLSGFIWTILMMGMMMIFFPPF